MAPRVGMTAMPELVALLHSFVGLAAVLVGFSLQLHLGAHLPMAEKIEIYIDVIIGAITTTGSVLAFLKLRGSVSGKPLLLPARHFLNLAMLIAIVMLGVLYGQQVGALEARSPPPAIACVLGVHLVAAIGGADMPVVVSMLNSYSGWTAAAAGFMLHNDLLIITGALVGSSGAILSYIMCKAMNRSIWNVIFGGFGAAPPEVQAAKPAQPAGRGPGDRRRGPRRQAQGEQERHHRPRLRHGRRARAARGPRDDRRPAQAGRQRAVRDPSGRRPPPRSHERAARRGERAVRHRARDGRDQPRLPARPTSRS